VIIDIETALLSLKNEKVIAIPTETVYGLAGDATSAIAVEKIYFVKNRPSDNPLICHFYSLDQIRKYIINEPNYLKVLVENFCPGPITFLLDLPENSNLFAATRGSKKLACRIPNHSVTLELLAKFNIPLAAPSANTSGQPSPTNTQMVEEDLGNKIDGILEGGQCEIGLESTIIDCTDNSQVIILRHGSIGKDEIEAIFKQNNLANIKVIEKDQIKESRVHKNSDSEAVSQVIPGNKYKHYSPKTFIVSINSVDEIYHYLQKFKIEDETITVITSTEKVDKKIRNINWLDLGNQNNLSQIAQNLYLILRKVDTYNQKQAFFLHFEFDKNSSLAKAFIDKLSKIL
jgi:L-threonylcarbamoyladenylate synthase